LISGVQAIVPPVAINKISFIENKQLLANKIADYSSLSTV
jgi:hypothetical protein